MSDKYKALDFILRRFMFLRSYDYESWELTIPLIDKYDSVEKIINESIGLGGGFSIDDCGEYFAVTYSQGVNIKLIKKINDEIYYDKIPKSEFIDLAKKMFAEYKNESIQLDLFPQK